MERPLCVRSSQNQAARIRLIVGVFLNNLANKESLKNFVNTDYSERFGFHLSTRMFGESAIPQTGSNLGIIHATTLNHVAQIYHLLGLSSWSGVPVDTVDGERCTAPSRSKVGSQSCLVERSLFSRLSGKTEPGKFFISARYGLSWLSS